MPFSAVSESNDYMLEFAAANGVLDYFDML
eukprot:SAG11_NODE_25215_length_362_cov_0.619772_2_plen_29_part_01